MMFLIRLMAMFSWLKSFLLSFLYGAFFLFCISSAVFVCLQFLPGDPAVLILGEDASLEQLIALREKLGLNATPLWQFWKYWQGILLLDFGDSIFYEKPVFDLLLERFWPSFVLSLFCLLLTTLFIFCGLWLVWTFRVFEKIGPLLSIVFMSVPSYFLAPALLYLFALKLSWFPVTGAATWAHYFLPSLSLSLVFSALLMRSLLPRLREISVAQFISAARAKGLSEQSIFFFHVLKNLLPPVLIYMSQMFGSVLSGAVIVESIFDLPGLGLLLYEAVSLRDFPVVQGCVLSGGAFFVLSHEFFSSLCKGLDPRVQK